jgi:hypothetical protein
MSFSYSRTIERLLAAIIVALSAPVLTACSGPAPGASAMPAQISHGQSTGDKSTSQKQLDFTYTTIDDPADPTTEILGINNLGKVCGFYGTPNVGIVVYPKYLAKNFRKEDYPGAVDTEVTSLNNSKTFAGWYLNNKNQTFGFTEWQHIFTTYQEPHTRGGSAQVTEILGIEDDGLAVGYYKDSTQILHPFELNTVTGKFTGITVPGAVNSVATGINGKGDIVGWLSLTSGITEGWMLKGGVFTFFTYPTSVATSPTGINWTDDIVGSYTDALSNTHGFLLTNVLTSQLWQQIDEPNAQGETVVTSVNNHHAMVGFYKDSTGNLNGFMAIVPGS